MDLDDIVANLQEGGNMKEGRIIDRRLQRREFMPSDLHVLSIDERYGFVLKIPWYASLKSPGKSLQFALYPTIAEEMAIIMNNSIYLRPGGPYHFFPGSIISCSTAFSGIVYITEAQYHVKSPYVDYAHIHEWKDARTTLLKYVFAYGESKGKYPYIGPRASTNGGKKNAQDFVDVAESLGYSVQKLDIQRDVAVGDEEVSIENCRYEATLPTTVILRRHLKRIAHAINR